MGIRALTQPLIPISYIVYPNSSWRAKVMKTEQRLCSREGLEDTTLLQIYTQLVRLRAFEERVKEIYMATLMPGLAHVYIGQEAVAVGVCAALQDGDYVTSTHRGHGHVLAKGGDPKLMMAEIMGRKTGYCRGKGGFDAYRRHLARHYRGKRDSRCGNSDCDRRGAPVEDERDKQCRGVLFRGRGV